MQIPNFFQDQFLNAPTLNTAVGYIKNSLETSNKTFYTPGLLYSQDLIYTFNNSLTVSLNASPPFAVVDANGILSQALGTTNGTTSSVYSLDFSSFVPSSGSVTVYITATTFSLSLQPYQVIGPPIGHPDYNPSFAPYTAYGETVDSLSITLSTTAPNNQTVFELGRVVLTSGQTAVTSVTTSYQVNCELYISAIDIQPVQNAIQIGQTTSTNQAVIAGVIPSGMSNNLIQFLVNGSNVFTVDNNGAITSAGNLSVGGIYATGGITADEGLTVNNAPAYLNAGLSIPSGQNASIGTMTASGLMTVNGGIDSTTVTASGLITANGGIDSTTVTASGLITANGGIDVSGGTLIVPNATTNNEAVALGQVTNVAPQTITLNGGVTANTTYGTTLTFDVPCAGFLVMQATFSNNTTGTPLTDATLELLFDGNLNLSDSVTSAYWAMHGFNPVSAGSHTATAQYIVGSVNLADAIDIRGIAFFIPNP